MFEYAALVVSPRALPDGLILVFQHPVKFRLQFAIFPRTTAVHPIKRNFKYLLPRHLDFRSPACFFARGNYLTHTKKLTAFIRICRNVQIAIGFADGTLRGPSAMARIHGANPKGSGRRGVLKTVKKLKQKINESSVSKRMSTKRSQSVFCISGTVHNRPVSLPGHGKGAPHLTRVLETRF